MNRVLFTLFVGSFCFLNADAADYPKPKLIEAKRIWDQVAHNAFTDLLFHQGRWLCVFREGSKHVSPDGSLRVIVSDDGEKWQSLALVTHPVEDLRDAKISVTPDGRMMLNGAGMQAEEKIRYHSMVWFSSDQGKTWSKEKRIGDPGFWLWRAQWHDGFCYSMGYRTDRDRDQRIARFYRSKDGEWFSGLRNCDRWDRFDSADLRYSEIFLNLRFFIVGMPNMKPWTPFWIAVIISALLLAFPLVMAFVIKAEGWAEAGWAYYFILGPVAAGLSIIGLIVSVILSSKKKKAGIGD